MASFDSAIYAFYQTYLNTPVWAAGGTATVKQAPARVVAATNTSERGIDAEMPSADAIERYRRLFATGEKVEDPRRRTRAEQPERPDISGSDLLADILGEASYASTRLGDRREVTLRLIRGRFFVYRYDPATRTDDHPHPTPGTRLPQRGATQDSDQPLCGTPPTLPLPPVPDSIREGRWYLVTELVFRLPYEGSRMN